MRHNRRSATQPIVYGMAWHGEQLMPCVDAVCAVGAYGATLGGDAG
jgi:hypothetical protein